MFAVHAGELLQQNVVAGVKVECITETLDYRWSAASFTQCHHKCRECRGETHEQYIFILAFY